MQTGGVDIGSVPDAELEVDGRGDPDQLGDVVKADEAAELGGRLDIDVEWDVDGGADGGDLRQRQVGRDVQRVRAQLDRDSGGERVGEREEDGDLRLHRRGQDAGLAHLPKRG